MGDSTLGNPGRLRPGLETIFVERHHFGNSRHSIKMFRSLAVTLAFVVAFVSADAVLDLGDADFDATLEEHDTALVMFYAPWCGHCKKMKPEFQKAAAVLAANDPPVALVQVDCTEAGKDTCGRFEVSGYPTVKIFRNGELSSDYKGPRESAGIVKFMKSQVGAASKDVSSPDDLVSYSKDNE